MTRVTPCPAAAESTAADEAAEAAHPLPSAYVETPADGKRYAGGHYAGTSSLGLPNSRPIRFGSDMSLETAHPDSPVACILFPAAMKGTRVPESPLREATQPEWDRYHARQQDPTFLTWLADMDRELDILFTQDAPGMPDDPYTVEGLRHAEQAALGWYWADDPMDLDWPERADRFQRYIGEMFIRHLEGRWEYAGTRRGDKMEPVIWTPFVDDYYRPSRLLDAAKSKKSGDRLETMYGYAQKRYRTWVTYGRMPLAEWLTFTAAHWREISALED